MAIVDLGSLKAAIASRVDRTDVTVAIEDAVDFATMRLSRDMRTFDQEARVALTNITTEYTTLPNDFGGARMVKINDELVEYFTPEAFQSYKEWKTNPGRPIYTIADNQIRVHPVPGGETIEILYHQRVVELTNTTDTNWVLTNHPDLYLCASMVEVLLHMKDEQRAAVWNERATSMIKEAIIYSRRRRYTGGQLVARQG